MATIVGEYTGSLPKSFDLWPITASEMVSRTDGTIWRRELHTCPDDPAIQVAFLAPLPSKLQGGRGYLKALQYESPDEVDFAAA